MADSPDLAVWLSAHYDEVEAAARAATPGPWTDFGKRPYGVEQLGYVDGHMVAEIQACDDDEHEHEDRQAADAYFIAALDPAWRLADLARKRQILAEHDDQHECTDRAATAFPYVGCRTVRLLAAEFADAPGYDDAWRP